MKTFNIQHSTFIILLLVAGGWLLVAGCTESEQRAAETAMPEGDLVRRAQLVGAENLRLKEQIETLQAAVADLQAQVEAEQAENARIMAQHGEIYKGLMQHLLDCSTKLEAYEQQ